MQADENDDIISGEELIADPTVDVEEQALLEIKLEMLRRALKTLTDDELQLIQALYLGKNECSERKIAAEMGLSQVAIHKRKKAVLEKLKNFFEF
jgi:RNA polymerase sigma factor (sigma-70 family)